jgi:hypothetical protein
MYLYDDKASRTRLDPDGVKAHTQAPYLILMDTDTETSTSERLRACVRQVMLRENGQSMVGKARIGGSSFTVEGAYGGGGLPVTVPQSIYMEMGTPLPERLFEAWDSATGLEPSPEEISLFREWGQENIDRLTPKDYTPRSWR